MIFSKERRKTFWDITKDMLCLIEEPAVWPLKSQFIHPSLLSPQLRPTRDLSRESMDRHEEKR